MGDRALTWSFCASCAYDVERVRSVLENGPSIRRGPQRRVHVPGAWCANPPLDSPLPTLLRAVLDREGILRRSLS